jgi:hypothetical protein
MHITKMIRLAFSIVLAAGLVVVAVQACGGKITVGYDDAGNYHTSDGGVLVYGSACVGWDASHYLVDGGFNCDPNNDQCTAWLTPPGYVEPYACNPNYFFDDAGNEIIDDASGFPLRDLDAGVCANSGPFLEPTCDMHDPNANAFCSAFYEQFVVSGHVKGLCYGVCQFDGISECAIGVGRIAVDGAFICGPPCLP